MKYAVLTAKQMAGHCLWSSGHTDYHVGTSGNKTDVVEAFVKACASRGVWPGIYYCSWDNHHLFGSQTPSDAAPFEKPLNLGNPLCEAVQLSYTTREYQEFQTAQIEELLARYGRIAEVWIDIPGVLLHCYRQALYRRIADLQARAVMYLTSISRGTNFLLDVGPDKHGLIPEKHQGALKRLRKNLDRLGM